jgi:hypothetical protein
MSIDPAARTADDHDPACCERAGPDRRQLLSTLSLGFGWLAFQGLAAAELPRAGGHNEQEPEDPRAPKAPHFAPRAKRVIFLCMSGGPSHVDTFDYKPRLQADTGQAAPGRARAGARLLGSPFAFRQHGQGGLWISELFPELARQADHLCLLRGMHTELPAHPQATLKLHTGSFQFVRPSLGAWTLYGLGTTNRNLPGFVTLNPPAGQGGAQNYGSAFLPAIYQGLRVGADRGALAAVRREETEAVANIRNRRLDARAQRRQLDLTQAWNRERLRREREDPGTEGVIESFELAFRMQAEVPDLLDLSKEPAAVRTEYGLDEAETRAFGSQCLIARRLAENGVRFIELNQGGWDHHRNLREDLAARCRSVDRPIAALLRDLARRGLLRDTLVMWGGEFGRTPYAQGQDGRDHNNQGFTLWMAGGGVKGGHAYGATDEHGIAAVEGRTSIHDWHATVLHLLGLDHERLTFRYAGRDFRLTDVHGTVIQDILA